MTSSFTVDVPLSWKFSGSKCQPPRRVRGLGSIAPKATLLGGEAIVQDVLVAGKVESNE